MGWSFTAPATLEALRLGDEPVLALANPLSEDQSVMRPLLLPGLLDAARDNAARGAGAPALFESQHVYRPGGDLTRARGQPRGRPAGRGDPPPGRPADRGAPALRREPVPGDFYAAKGLVEAVGAAARRGAGVRRPEDARPSCTRAARRWSRRRRWSWAGSASCTRWSPAPGTCEGGAAFELDFDALAAAAPEVEQFADVTSFPAVRQDIAVVAPAGVEAEAIRLTVLEPVGSC